MHVVIRGPGAKFSLQFVCVCHFLFVCVIFCLCVSFFEEGGTMDLLHASQMDGDFKSDFKKLHDEGKRAGTACDFE